jgi:hypothetical protein
MYAIYSPNTYIECTYPYGGRWPAGQEVPTFKCTLRPRLSTFKCRYNDGWATDVCHQRPIGMLDNLRYTWEIEVQEFVANTVQTRTERGSHQTPRKRNARVLPCCFHSGSIYPPRTSHQLSMNYSAIPIGNDNPSHQSSRPETGFGSRPIIA